MTLLTPAQAAGMLTASTIAMHQAGVPLMRRILPSGEDIAQWAHYPPDDCISPQSGARYFYHCHPPEERGDGEHGHFHLFLGKSTMPAPDAFILRPADDASARADVVHVAGLSITPQGLPVALFTVNRWVTDEWLFAAADILDALVGFDLRDAPGDALVNVWLTAIVHTARPILSGLLAERDAALRHAAWDGENRALEILSHQAIDIDQLV